MTTATGVADVVHDHLVSTYAPDTDHIPSDYDLLEGGVLDSLTLVSLLSWIGRRFTLPIEELDLDPRRLRSIAAIAEFIEAHTQVPSRTS